MAAGAESSVGTLKNMLKKLTQCIRRKSENGK